MKILGGRWSKGDFIAIAATIFALLAVPGMPKVFHWDESPKQEAKAQEAKKPEAAISIQQDAKDSNCANIVAGGDSDCAVGAPPKKVASGSNAPKR